MIISRNAYEPYLITTLTAEFVHSQDHDEVISYQQRAASKVRYARAIIRDKDTGDYHVFGIKPKAVNDEG